MQWLQAVITGNSGSIETTGERYVHIIDPTTGYSKKSNILSVSVIANTCMEADAYATAFMVMDLEATKKLVQQLGTLEVYVIMDTNGTLTTYQTKGFEAIHVP